MEGGADQVVVIVCHTLLCCSRKNPFALLVALDDNQSGEGWLFWDDGETLQTYENGNYSLLHFTAQKV